MRQIVRNKVVWIGLVALLVAGVATATGDQLNRVEGEVVSLESVMQPDGTSFDELVVQDQNRARMRLRLGEAGSCVDCVQEGDRIRARLMRHTADGATHEVRKMQVRRSGETLQFRNRSGELIQQRTCLRSNEDNAAGSATRHRGGGSQTHGGGHHGGRR